MTDRFTVHCAPDDCGHAPILLLRRLVGARVLLADEVDGQLVYVAEGIVRAVAEGAVHLEPLPDENGERETCPCCDGDSVVMMIPFGTFGHLIYQGEEETWTEN